MLVKQKKMKKALKLEVISAHLDEETESSESFRILHSKGGVPVVAGLDVYNVKLKEE